MYKIKFLALGILLLFFCGINHSQDQTFTDNILVGGDDSQIGENKRLYLGGPGEGTDPLWISRYDRAFNQSDLRINISDDEAGDRLVVGTTWWADGQFHPYFVVQSNGRVGIGTETIGDERLAVNGKIRTKEVVVEANSWDTPWPDYVFDKSYKLSSLTKVEDYIQKNGHLPEMPSDAVVEKEGVELGEMNKLLVKKIEEMTLHLIEQEKEIKELQRIVRVHKNWYRKQ